MMAVQRFVLDSTTLDNTGFGLDGGAAFILDSSALDGARVLDGGEFLTVAIGTSSLGGLVASASAVVTVGASGSSALGGLAGSASITVVVNPVASAPLGGLDASATSKARKSAVANADLDGLDASATSKARKSAVANADLGGLDAAASAQVTPPEPPPVDDGVGYQPYTQAKRKPLPMPKPIIVEVPKPRKPRVVRAVASSRMGGAGVSATGSIMFSILDDDAEVLLLV